MLRKSIAFLIGLMVLWGGQALAQAKPFYEVKPGDTLYSISQRQGVSLLELKKANRLTEAWIYPGELLYLPGANLGEAKAILAANNLKEADWQILAQAIYAEARGESFSGQAAVGAVILNRLQSPDFPDTIREIVFQNNGRVYQFSCVEDGNIYLEPNATAYKAALAAIEGYDPTGGSLYFYNPQTASDRWIKTLPVMTQIGNHVFALDF